MNKHNYDSKSSIFSAQYKIPYDCSESSRIVEHLEESQEQLQFLKDKLTQTYEKLQMEIRSSMNLQDENNNMFNRVKQMQEKLRLEELQNRKLKDVMESVLKNRKILEQQIEYTHKRYKKLLAQKQSELEEQKEKNKKIVLKLKSEIQFMEEQLENGREKQLIEKFKSKQKQYESKINILEHEIVKLTNEKATEVSRLRQEIDCYQRTVSPIKQFSNSRTTTNVDTEPHKENTFLQISGIHQSDIYQSSKLEEDSVGKWNKKSRVNENSKMTDPNKIMVEKPLTLKAQNSQNIDPNYQKPLTDDQKLTRCQIEKKNVENKLIKIQRLKRHTPEDRQAMQTFEKKLYQLDSQISTLKRRIRQKY